MGSVRKMSVVFEADPQLGRYPLDVNVSDVAYGSEIAGTEVIVSAGYLGDGEGVASAGYLGTDDDPSLEWTYGDGDGYSGLQPPPHRYLNPGTYPLTARLFVGGLFDSFYTLLIKVLDDVLINLGIGGNTEGRRSLSYGSDNEQGMGWSEDGDDGNIWPDTKSSILDLFDDNQDRQVVIFDSLTGLPFCDNPRKSYTGSRIVDAWKDKIDPLIENSGTEIRTRAKLQEMVGSHESFEQRMSDIFLYFSPIYKENQGAIGYNEDGLRDALKVNLELYKDDELDLGAIAVNVPMKRELFFFKEVFGSTLQIAFETTASEYRFDKAECKLENYDKARYPFGDPMTEEAYQESLANINDVWLSRDGFLFNRVNGVEYTGNISSPNRTGPDGKTGSIFYTTSNYDLLNSASTSVSIWSTEPDPTLIFVGETVVLRQQQEVSGRVWYLYTLDTAPSNLEVVPYKDYFDFRTLNEVLAESAIEYYFNDVVNNGGEITCPRF